MQLEVLLSYSASRTQERITIYDMPQTFTKPQQSKPWEAPNAPGVFTPAVAPKPMSVAGTGQGQGNDQSGSFATVAGIELLTPSFNTLTSGPITGEVQQTAATVPVAAVTPRTSSDASQAADGVTALTLISVGAAMKFGGAIITGLATIVTTKQAVSGIIGWLKEFLSGEAKNKLMRVNELINTSVDKVTAPRLTDVFVGDRDSDTTIRTKIKEAVQGGQSRSLLPPHVMVVGENGVKEDVAEDIAAKLKVPLITVDCSQFACKSIAMNDFISRLEEEVLPGSRSGWGRWFSRGGGRTEAVLSLIGLEQLVDKNRDAAASLIDGIRDSRRLEASAMLVVTIEKVHKQNVQQLLLKPLEVTIPSPATPEMTAKVLQARLPRLELSDAEALRVSHVFGARLLSHTTLQELMDLNLKYQRGSQSSPYDLLIVRMLDSCYEERNTGHLTEEDSNLHKEVAIAESFVAGALGVSVIGFSAQAGSMDKLVYRSRLSQTSSEITDPEVVMKELVIAFVRHEVLLQSDSPIPSRIVESRKAIRRLAPQVHEVLEAKFSGNDNSDLTQLEFDHAVQAVMERAERFAQKITKTLTLPSKVASLHVLTAAASSSGAPEMLGSAFDRFLDQYRDSLHPIEHEFREFFTNVTKMAPKNS